MYHFPVAISSLNQNILVYSKILSWSGFSHCHISLEIQTILDYGPLSVIFNPLWLHKPRFWERV